MQNVAAIYSQKQQKRIRNTNKEQGVKTIHVPAWKDVFKNSRQNCENFGLMEGKLKLRENCSVA